MITVRIEPRDQTMEFRRLNTTLQLLNKLGLSRTDALVIRDGELLTPDRRIRQGDEITVRIVASGG
jgi:sulfur carrier protein